MKKIEVSFFKLNLSLLLYENSVSFASRNAIKNCQLRSRWLGLAGPCDRVPVPDIIRESSVLPKCSS